MVKKVLEAIGESEHTISQVEKALSPPHRYLLALDTIAHVRMGGGHLNITPRRSEWLGLTKSLLSEAEPYKEEIYRLVRQREEGACLHCKHWTPLDDSWGICDLTPGLCGRLYGCNKFQQRRKSHGSKESV